LRAATQSLLIDERDPAAHWAMGRALWLGRRDDRSIEALGRAVDLSPNFALGHYALAFVNAQTGDPRAAIASADESRRLSPFDPLLFGMLAARAMALVRLGRLDEAAEWAVKAARRPNAHPHIDAIAAFCLALAGATDEAGVHAEATRRALPGYRSADFFRAFRFHPDDAARFREGAARVGMT
jgi:tetratricopeptide (TPR) repeat protein